MSKENEINDKIHTIPKPTLRRLPWYLSFVQLLKNEGHEHVSSTRIAQGVGVDSALVAKDLSYVQLQGRREIGRASCRERV